jgi:hypothetical protein
VNETTENLNKATEAAHDFANDAGTAFNTIAAGCSGLWDAGVSAVGLAWEGKTTDALAVMFGPTLSCYDSVVAAVMGLFPSLS